MMNDGEADSFKDLSWISWRSAITCRAMFGGYAIRKPSFSASSIKAACTSKSRRLLHRITKTTA